MMDRDKLMKQHEIHNEVAGDIVKRIVAPVLLNGGGGQEILVLLESIVVGTMLATTKLGGDKIILDVFVEGVRQRLAEIRLSGIETAGIA